MSKILQVYEREIPTVSIMRNAAQLNTESEGSETKFVKITDVTAADIDWCDVFSMIRPSDPYSVFLAKRARESGRFVVAFYDDDLYNPPVSRPTAKWRIRCVREALQTANMVSTCSPHIAEKYRNLTGDKRSVCSGTIVNPNEIKLIPELTDVQPGQKVKILYAANASHVAFFNHFILPIMPKLADQYAGKISMTFMGVNPELSQFKDRIEIEHFDTMPLDEYREKAQSGNYDIGLSPLTTDEFTKCKYFNKFIEYTMAGVVGVYSNTEPYTYVVKDGENGFLVNDDPEDWYGALCKVIDDAFLRNRCVRNAQNLLLTDFTNEAVVKKQKKEAPELAAYDAPKIPCKSLRLHRMLYWRIPVADKLYQSWFYLRHTGVSGFIKKVKSHIRHRKTFSK